LCVFRSTDLFNFEIVVDFINEINNNFKMLDHLQMITKLKSHMPMTHGKGRMQPVHLKIRDR